MKYRVFKLGYGGYSITGVDATFRSEREAQRVCNTLNGLIEENEQKIIDVLDKHIHYAETQAHNNLDNVIVYNSYRMLSYTIKLIADELGIELEGLN